MEGGGEHKVNLLSRRNQTPTHVHLSQGAAVVTQILWWAVVCHTVQQQAEQRTGLAQGVQFVLHELPYMIKSHNLKNTDTGNCSLIRQNKNQRGGQSQYPVLAGLQRSQVPTCVINLW